MLWKSNEIKAKPWLVFRQSDNKQIGKVHARFAESAIQKASDKYGKDHGLISVKLRTSCYDQYRE